MIGFLKKKRRRKNQKYKHMFDKITISLSDMVCKREMMGGAKQKGNFDKQPNISIKRKEWWYGKHTKRPKSL